MRHPARPCGHSCSMNPLSPAHAMQPVGGAGARARGLVGSEVTTCARCMAMSQALGCSPKRPPHPGAAPETSSEMSPDLSPHCGAQDTSSWVPVHKGPGEHFWKKTAMLQRQGHGELHGRLLAPHRSPAPVFLVGCALCGAAGATGENKPEGSQPSLGLTTGDKDSHPATSEACGSGQVCRHP